MKTKNGLFMILFKLHKGKFIYTLIQVEIVFLFTGCIICFWKQGAIDEAQIIPTGASWLWITAEKEWEKLDFTYRSAFNLTWSREFLTTGCLIDGRSRCGWGWNSWARSGVAWFYFLLFMILHLALFCWFWKQLVIAPRVQKSWSYLSEVWLWGQKNNDFSAWKEIRADVRARQFFKEHPSDFQKCFKNFKHWRLKKKLVTISSL